MSVDPQKPVSEAPSPEILSDPDKWWAYVQNDIRRDFLRTGSLDPGARILATAHPQTGAALDTPMDIPVSIAILGGGFNPEVKDKFRDFLTEIGRKSRALAVVFYSEAWLAMFTSKEQAKRISSESSLANVPGRIESLLVTYERRGRLGASTWVAPIKRPEGKPLALEPFMEVPGDGHGRFENLLRNDKIQ